MKNFTYFRPATPEAAIGLLEPRWGKTELLGGGTDLHDLQKEYVAQPDKVISLSAIPGFADITQAKDGLQLGAGAKLSKIAVDNLIKTHCTALAQAAGNIGGPQIRNMGTLG